jgi:hypothetical protein
MEDREKSTPVICANADFFPQIPTVKSPVKMRLKNAALAAFLVFHKGFHRTAERMGLV